MLFDGEFRIKEEVLYISPPILSDEEMAVSRTRRNVRKLAGEEQARMPGVMTAFTEVMREVRVESLPDNLYGAFIDFYGKATRHHLTPDAFSVVSKAAECTVKRIITADGISAVIALDGAIHAFFSARVNNAAALKSLGQKIKRVRRGVRAQDSALLYKSRHNAYTPFAGSLATILNSVPHKGDFGRGTIYIPK